MNDTLRVTAVALALCGCGAATQERPQGASDARILSSEGDDLARRPVASPPAADDADALVDLAARVPADATAVAAVWLDRRAPMWLRSTFDVRFGRLVPTELRPLVRQSTVPADWLALGLAISVLRVERDDDDGRRMFSRPPILMFTHDGAVVTMVRMPASYFVGHSRFGPVQRLSGLAYYPMSEQERRDWIRFGQAQADLGGVLVVDAQTVALVRGSQAAAIARRFAASTGPSPLAQALTRPAQYVLARIEAGPQPSDPAVSRLSIEIRGGAPAPDTMVSVDWTFDVRPDRVRAVRQRVAAVLTEAHTRVEGERILAGTLVTQE